MNKKGMHRLLSGEYVEPISHECLEDLNIRIEDATFNRDTCPRGSASRTHYNGLLSLLRKQRKNIVKNLPSDSKDSNDIDESIPDFQGQAAAGGGYVESKSSLAGEQHASQGRQGNAAVRSHDGSVNNTMQQASRFTEGKESEDSIFHLWDKIIK